VTAHLEEGDDRRAIVAAGLLLEFRWTGDRWSHALGIGPDLVRVARTVEDDRGGDDPARVVSPAYQQLQCRRAPGGAQVLLVGQSGPHHFSAAFTVREIPGEVGVEADVADRCRAEVVALSCTYRLDLPAGDLVEAEAARLVWEPAPLGSGRLVLEAPPPGRVACAEAGRRALHVQAEARIDPAGHTQRCVYRWRWITP
jgi:hypothetical protein